MAASDVFNPLEENKEIEIEVQIIIYKDRNKHNNGSIQITVNKRKALKHTLFVSCVSIVYALCLNERRIKVMPLLQKRDPIHYLSYLGLAPP